MGLLRIYSPHLHSLFAHPEPDPTPDSDRGRESRAASATGRPQPKSSPAATASARSILLDDSLATLEELAGGVDHRQIESGQQVAALGFNDFISEIIRRTPQQAGGV